jgi:hypothetical protein
MIAYEVTFKLHGTKQTRILIVLILRIKIAGHFFCDKLKYISGSFKI